MHILERLKGLCNISMTISWSCISTCDVGANACVQVSVCSGALQPRILFPMASKCAYSCIWPACMHSQSNAVDRNFQGSVQMWGGLEICSRQSVQLHLGPILKDRTANSAHDQVRGVGGPGGRGGWFAVGLMFHSLPRHGCGDLKHC